MSNVCKSQPKPNSNTISLSPKLNWSSQSLQEVSPKSGFFNPILQPSTKSLCKSLSLKLNIGWQRKAKMSNVLYENKA